MIDNIVPRAGQLKSPPLNYVVLNFFWMFLIKIETFFQSGHVFIRFNYHVDVRGLCRRSLLVSVLEKMQQVCYFVRTCKSSSSIDVTMDFAISDFKKDQQEYQH